MHQRSSSSKDEELTVKAIASQTIGRNNYNSAILGIIPEELATKTLNDSNKREISAAIDALRHSTTEALRRSVGEYIDDLLENLMHDGDAAKYAPAHVQKLVREMMFLALLSQEISRR